VRSTDVVHGYAPIGIDTPTNVPFCNAGPTLSTKLPSMIPMAMARKIQTARKRSRRPRLLKADSFGAWRLFSESAVGCSSASLSVVMGGVFSLSLGNSSTFEWRFVVSWLAGSVSLSDITSIKGFIRI
jgi:hypothetical protein